MKKILQLYWQFFKFGCFTFGGGWSIIAQMQKKYIEEEQIMTKEELLDITSVGRSLPGTMIGNVAFLFGYHVAGVMGGIVCVVGMIMPPMIILIFITLAYSVIRDNVWVARAMTGVRSAVVPIIACAGINLWSGAFRYPVCYVLMAAAFAMYLFAGIGCLTIVIFGIIMGIVICEWYERCGKGAKS